MLRPPEVLLGVAYDAWQVRSQRAQRRKYFDDLMPKSLARKKPHEERHADGNFRACAADGCGMKTSAAQSGGVRFDDLRNSVSTLLLRQGADAGR